MIVSSVTLRRWLGPRRYELYGDLVQALSATLVLGVWWLVGIVVVRLTAQTIAQPGRSDFTIFYFTARMVLDGLSPYGELPASYGVSWPASHLGNLNPPHVPLLMAPLARLAYADAAALWVASSYASAAAMVWATGRTLGAPWTLRRTLVWGAAIIANVGFLSVAVTGEWTWFLVWPFWLAWRAGRRGRWTEAGIWLGVCAGTKLFFLLFLPLLACSRRGRACAAMIATALAVLAAPIVFQPALIVDWVRTLDVVKWWWHPMNLSWRGLISRTLMPSRDYPATLHLPSWVEPLTIFGVVVIAAFVVVWVLRRTIPPDADQLFSVGLLTSLVLSPLGWVYYLPLLVPPMLGLAWTGRLRGLGRSTTCALVVGLAGWYVPLEWVTASGGGSWLAAATFGSLYAWSALFVLWALTRVVAAPAPRVSS